GLDGRGAQADELLARGVDRHGGHALGLALDCGLRGGALYHRHELHAADRAVARVVLDDRRVHRALPELGMRLRGGRAGGGIAVLMRGRDPDADGAADGADRGGAEEREGSEAATLVRGLRDEGLLVVLGHCIFPIDDEAAAGAAAAGLDGMAPPPTAPAPGIPEAVIAPPPMLTGSRLTSAPAIAIRWASASAWR